jgi:hypothetical protein
MRSDCKDSPNCDTFYLEEIIIVLGMIDDDSCSIAVRYMNVEFVKFTFFKSIMSKLSKDGLVDYSKKWYEQV